MPAVWDMEQAQPTEVDTQLRWGTVSAASKKGPAHLADFN